MKILWIVNILLNPLSSYLYRKKSNGVWIDALLNSFRNHPEYEISVATVAAVSETVRVEEDGIVYYALPDSPPLAYNENKNENILAWRKLLTEERFDLIEVWGTEFTHGLCALREAQDTPCLIYMQGYLASIARHYTAGITHREIRSCMTFRDIIKKDDIERQQKKYYQNAEKEREMLALAKNVICENDWCDNSLKAVVDGINVYRCPLSINRVFFDVQRAKEPQRHSIICNASGYPLKGQHMLFKAVALLKKKYPDIKLYIPGFMLLPDGSFREKLRRRGYTEYLTRLIKELRIEENVVWLGSLTQEELAASCAKTELFVLCSSIENHSSSLKEAMMVGMPCIASAVGGVPEYVTHGHDGLLYRFGDYDVMASYIETLFEDRAFAEKLAANARASMEHLHSEEEIFQITCQIYQTVVGEKQ